MDKIVIQKAGGYEELKVVENLPIPKPFVREALVDIHYFGVNYADVCVRMGLYSSAKKYVGWPITPGFEFSGKIIGFGNDADECEVEYFNEKKNVMVKRTLRVGMMVMGVTRFGAYSTHVCVSVDYLYSLPNGLTLEEAAGFPAVYLTAYYAMHELAHPRKNQWLLVHSAAGGVGSALVQLGKIAGCKVVGVVGSEHKKAAVQQLGAVYVCDKQTHPNWAIDVLENCNAEPLNNGDGFDVVFDANGVETLKKSYDLLASGGKLVVYGFHSMLPKAGGKPNWLKLAWDWIWTPSFDPLKLTGANKSVLAFNLSYLFSKTSVFSDKQLGLGFVLQYKQSGSRNRRPSVCVVEIRSPSTPRNQIGDIYGDCRTWIAERGYSAIREPSPWDPSPGPSVSKREWGAVLMEDGLAGRGIPAIRHLKYLNTCTNPPWVVPRGQVQFLRWDVAITSHRRGNCFSKATQFRFAEFMEDMFEKIESGALKPPKVTIYNGLQQVKQAHIDIESGNTIGKLVIAIPR